MKGSIVAIITPFTKEKEVDYKTLEKLVEWQIEEGTDAIVCLGTTGESPTINSLERRKIIERCVQVANKRVPIIVGTGTNCTKTTCELTEQAKFLGADAALVIVPYYSKPSQKGCVYHFTEVGKYGFPIMLYHHPGRTAVRLQIETIKEIVHKSSVVSIKESSGDLAIIPQIKSFFSGTLLTGDDPLLIPSMERGCDGIVSVCANIIPKEIKKSVSFCAKGDFFSAKENEKEYLTLMKAIFTETNPQGIKYALSIINKCQSFYRLPMIEPADENKKLIEKACSIFFEESAASIAF